MTHPAEEDLPEGEPPAVDAGHWSALKEHYRADAVRADARRHIIETAEKDHR
jgi:hypothetical protein